MSKLHKEIRTYVIMNFEDDSVTILRVKHCKISQRMLPFLGHSKLCPFLVGLIPLGPGKYNNRSCLLHLVFPKNTLANRNQSAFTVGSFNVLKYLLF